MTLTKEEFKELNEKLYNDNRDIYIKMKDKKWVEEISLCMGTWAYCYRLGNEAYNK